MTWCALRFCDEWMTAAHSGPSEGLAPLNMTISIEGAMWVLKLRVSHANFSGFLVYLIDKGAGYVIML